MPCNSKNKRPLVNMLHILVLLLAIVPCLIHGEETFPPTISVSGQAELRVVPDRVTLQFGIESRGKQLTEAVKENDGKVAKVIEFLKSLDITERSIRTELISITPIYMQ